MFDALVGDTTVHPFACLQHRLDAALDARLTPDDAAPLVAAFSGGGDSLALLLAAKAWADRRGRRLLAVTVDHRLRPEGADWALWCRQRALRLGVDHQIRLWDGDKPPTGLAAAARGARHALLAEATRRAGGCVILMGHTADDRAEAAVMRAAGSSTPTPRAWAPSPVWPEGRGVFLLRPFLDERRGAIRAALAALGETWIDDPANADPASPRARARALLAGTAPEAGEPPPDSATDPAAANLAPVGEGPAGELTLPLDWLTGTRHAGAVLGAALLCAAGADRPPRRAALDRLLAKAASGDAFAATLAGARVECDGRRLLIVRDAADRRRGDGGDTALPAGRVVVWDGRFAVRTTTAGARVGLLAGRAARLPPALRRALRTVPAAARPALPVVLHDDGAIDCPSLLPTPRAAADSLGRQRLLAASGAIVNEAALRRMAKHAGPS